MADKKISELDPILGADSATGDLFVLVDISGNVTGHMTRAELIEALGPNFTDITASGIFLGGSAPANKLDDYEEGAWTPAVSFSGGSTGIIYADRDGIYTKIGNVVIASGTIELSDNGTDLGTMAITGLPFVVSDEFTGTTIQGGGLVGFWTGLATAVMSITLTPIQNSSSARVRRIIAATIATGSLTEAEFGDTGALRFQVIYRTA